MNELLAIYMGTVAANFWELSTGQSKNSAQLLEFARKWLNLFFSKENSGEFLKTDNVSIKSSGFLIIELNGVQITE